MADGRRVGEFPHNVVGDQRLPFGSIMDERFNVSLQEVRGDCGHVIWLSCRRWFRLENARKSAYLQLGVAVKQWSISSASDNPDLSNVQSIQVNESAPFRSLGRLK